jgi:hypothetical protein
MAGNGRFAVAALALLAGAGCGAPASGAGYDARVREVAARVELSSARTLQACSRADLGCADSASAGAAAARRAASDLLALRASPGHRDAKRQLAGAIEAVARSSDALAAGRGARAEALQVLEQSRRTLADGALPALASVPSAG